MKQPCKKLYHVFSNNCDEWTEDLKKAVKIARQWAREFKCVRIYEEVNWNVETGSFEDESCILSHGSFPW